MPEEKLRSLLRLVDAIDRLLYDVIGISRTLRKHEKDYNELKSIIEDVYKSLASYLKDLFDGFAVDTELLKKELDKVILTLDEIEDKGFSEINGTDIEQLRKFINDLKIFVEIYDWKDELNRVKNRLEDVRDFLDPDILRILDIPLEDLSLSELIQRLNEFIDRVDEMVAKLFEDMLKEQVMEKEEKYKFMKEVLGFLDLIKKIDANLALLLDNISKAYELLKDFKTLEDVFKRIFKEESFKQLKTIIEKILERWRYTDISGLVEFLRDKKIKLETLKAKLPSGEKAKLDDVNTILDFSLNTINILDNYLSIIDEIDKMISSIAHFFKKVDIPIETIDVKDKFIDRVDEIRTFFSNIIDKTIKWYGEYIAPVVPKEIAEPEELTVAYRPERRIVHSSTIDVPLSIGNLSFIFEIYYFERELVITSTYNLETVASVSIDISSLSMMQEKWKKFIDKNVVYVKGLSASDDDLSKLNNLKDDKEVLEFFNFLIGAVQPEVVTSEIMEALYLREPVLDDIISVLESLNEFIRHSKDINQIKNLLSSLKRKLKEFGKIKHQDRVIDANIILELISDIEYAIDITYGLTAKEAVEMVSSEIETVIDKLSREYLYVG